MPNQVLKTSFAVKALSYKKILSGQKKLILRILVNYTDQKEESAKYYTDIEWEFNPTLIPPHWHRVTPLSPIEMTVVWTVKSADMK